MANLRADARNYHYRTWWAAAGFWITATYRFGAWARTIPWRPLRVLLRVVHVTAAWPWRFFKSVEISSRTVVGPGFCMHHPHCIIVAPDVVIGARCTLYHEVTLGRGPVPGVPTLGDDVVVFAGAKVLGGIRIGGGAQVGANAVVVRDVPAGAVVAAPPARALPADTAERIGGPRDQSV
jgi:serine O-acetyltransferase